MIRVVILVFLEGSVFQGLEKGGVLLEGEVVGGDVIGFQGNGVTECAFPVCEGLAGDGKHQVDVDRGDSGFAEDADGF